MIRREFMGCMAGLLFWVPWLRKPKRKRKIPDDNIHFTIEAVVIDCSEGGSVSRISDRLIMAESTVESPHWLYKFGLELAFNPDDAQRVFASRITGWEPIVVASTGHDWSGVPPMLGVKLHLMREGT